MKVYNTEIWVMPFPSTIIISPDETHLGGNYHEGVDLKQLKLLFN